MWRLFRPPDTMNKKIETKLIECHILMSEALKAYEDRAVQSNKLYELKQYSDQLPDEMNKKVTEYVDTNIRPMIYDVDYWSFIEKDEQYGSYDDKNHFIVNSNSSLESIIFKKYHYVYDLLQKLNDFMSVEFHLNYDR